MTRGIYLRANAEINCFCSTGEFITLAQLPVHTSDFNFIKDYYWNDKFSHIRESFKKNRLPFPDYCAKCKYLDPFGTYDEEKSHREIEWIHAEPSSLCNLQCSYCVHGSTDSQVRKNPCILPIILYEKILTDIKNEGYSIKWAYFQGRGEPGLHPDLWEMVKKTKDNFDTNFMVGTNGNITYSDHIVHSGLDKIKIAVDSIIPDVYQKYRAKGNINRLFELTEKIVNEKQKSNKDNPVVVWQKVLFNFNDSEEELIDYQKKALELGVDRLRIVYTFTENHSEKLPKNFPKIFPDIEFFNALESHNINADFIALKHEFAQEKNEVSYYVDLLAKIIYSCELGLSSRVEINRRAEMSLSNSDLLKDGNNNFCQEEIYHIYRESLGQLSKIYAENGDVQESARYAQYFNELAHNL